MLAFLNFVTPLKENFRLDTLNSASCEQKTNKLVRNMQLHWQMQLKKKESTCFDSRLSRFKETVRYCLDDIGEKIEERKKCYQHKTLKIMQIALHRTLNKSIPLTSKNNVCKNKQSMLQSSQFLNKTGFAT